jgi:hypothetical protein
MRQVGGEVALVAHQRSRRTRGSLRGVVLLVLAEEGAVDGGCPWRWAVYWAAS